MKLRQPTTTPQPVATAPVEQVADPVVETPQTVEHEHSAPPDVDGEIISVPVLGPAKNPRFVYAVHGGWKIAVSVAKKYHGILKGKTINVRVTTEGDTTIYTHIP